MDITIDDIYCAKDRISGRILKTDIVPLMLPNGSRCYLKTESLQLTGSFKVRGAFNKLIAMSESGIAGGVVAASAGNHAQGVALAARELGVPAYIVMPVTAPLQKVNSTRKLGARVTLQGDTFDDAMEYAKIMQKENGLTLIHAFNDPLIIAGQGTMGLEILDDMPDVDSILVPVGGGGMIAGIAIAVKSLRPDVKIIGVEPIKACSMKESLSAGCPIKLEKVGTIADGVAIKSPGEITYDMCSRYLDGVITVDEDEIASSILYLMESAKMVVEGAGAVAVAAILHGDIDVKNKKVLAVVSGGNIDVQMISRIIDKGLLKDGRRVTLHTLVPDRPGQLSGALDIISALEANILNVQHERNRLGIEVSQVAIEFMLETYDRQHITSIINALEKSGYPIQEITN